MVGYGGCETRIEGIVQCTKRYSSILRNLRKCGGGVGGGGVEVKGGGLGVRVDVNAMLEVGVKWGMGDVNPGLKYF